MEVFVNCDNCHQEVNVADHEFERLLPDEGLVLTILECPHCNREMVVQIDSTTTLKLFQRQINLLNKIGKTQYLTGNPTAQQSKKLAELSQSLISARQELMNKYNHTSYQFEGQQHKLDFYAPSVTIGKGE